ncbi:MAG: NADH-quinone oxidoreductase subunit H [Deltaproteobacteria bacterium]|nr:NADH-quinone oxidoreductase subunit H [Deltaproteobacteria bacterium]
MPNALQVVGFFCALLIAYPAIAWLERRSALDVLRPYRLLRTPLLPLADVLKHLAKRGSIPAEADAFQMRLAPFIGLLPVVLVIAALPVAPVVDGPTQVSLTDGSAPILMPFAFLLLSTLGIAFGGAGSGNPLALLTSLRLCLVRISTLLTSVIACLSIARLSHSPTLSGVVMGQLAPLSKWTGALPAWGILASPLAFATALLSLALLAQRMHRSRMDHLHDLEESYVAKISGPLLLVTRVFEILDLFAGACLLTVFFLGGWSLPGLDVTEALPSLNIGLLHAAVFLGKAIALSAAIVFLRRGLPSFSAGQLWRLVWLILLPTATLSFFLPLSAFLPG